MNYTHLIFTNSTYVVESESSIHFLKTALVKQGQTKWDDMSNQYGGHRQNK